MNKGINRRSFLKTSALGVTGAGIAGVQPLLADKESPALSKIKTYQTLGRTGFKASDIGIGTSRQFVVPVINALLDAGVNYIDTAERYGRGTAESNIGTAIKSRERESLFITTKLGLRGTETKEEIISRFGKCMERLQTPYIDCLMIHGASVDNLKLDAFHQAAKHLKKEGKLKFLGASNHGARFREGVEDVMEKSLTTAAEDGRFDVLLLVYNFLKQDAGQKIMDTAKKNNVATTIMKSDPVGRYYEMQARVEEMKKDGKEPDPRTARYLERMSETAKQADDFIKKNKLDNPVEIRQAALRFVLNEPKVDVLTLAFSSFEDVENMLKLSGSRLSSKDKKKLAAYQRGCSSLYCRHACGICESSCPYLVPVNTIMRYNHYFDAHNSEKYAMEKYAALSLSNSLSCQNCSGHCEKACPYGVPVQSMVMMAHRQLTLT